MADNRVFTISVAGLNITHGGKESYRVSLHSKSKGINSILDRTGTTAEDVCMTGTLFVDCVGLVAKVESPCSTESIGR